MGVLALTSVLVALAIVGDAYPTFKDRIPNGHVVKHPCGLQYSWSGVGHQNPKGGGNRNQFGLDFKAASMEWTVEFCQKDSDGDGLSNGEELGDPTCVWTPGSETSEEAKSHPGVCEPVDSLTCAEANSWLNCEEVKREECSAKSEQGIKNITLQFPVMNLPESKTNYYCQVFELPSQGDFHLVATTPIVNNTDIVHHMLLFACDERQSEVNATTNPYPCGMTPSPQCNQIIGTWTVGGSGDCLFPEAGFRIGRYGFRKAALQIHWNNPYEKSGEIDSSGMTLFYTSRIRKYDANTLIVGQQHLEIPPMASGISFSARCPGGCTQSMIKNKIYVTRAVNHMHFLGTAQRISLHRNGSKVTDLTNDIQYDYNSPVYYHYDHPVEIYSGDEIQTTCTYSSHHKNRTVYFGDATDDEMCYGFLTYYPAQNLKPAYCFSWKSLDECQKRAPAYNGLLNGCPWRDYRNMSSEIFQSLYKAVARNCYSLFTNRTCSSACRQAVREARANRCLRDDIGEYLMHYMSRTEMGYQVVSALITCSSEPETSNSRRIGPAYTVLLTVLSFCFVTLKQS